MPGRVYRRTAWNREWAGAPLKPGRFYRLDPFRPWQSISDFDILLPELFPSFSSTTR